MSSQKKKSCLTKVKICFKEIKSFFFEVLEKLFLFASVLLVSFLILYFAKQIICKSNFLDKWGINTICSHEVEPEKQPHTVKSEKKIKKKNNSSLNQSTKKGNIEQKTDTCVTSEEISLLKQQIANYKENQKDLKTLLFLFSALITFIVMAFGYLEWGNLKNTLELFLSRLNEQKVDFQKEREKLEKDFQKERKELEKELKNTLEKNVNSLIRHQLEEIILLTDSARKMLVGIYKEGIKKSLESIENEIKVKCNCDVDLSDGINNLYDLIRKHDILIRLFSEDKELVLSALYKFNANPFVEAEERLKILKSRYLNDDGMLEHINRALRLIEEIRLKNL